MSISLFDLHCDTAYALLNGGEGKTLDLRSNNLHISLDKASEFQNYVQCFACFTSPEDSLCQKHGSVSVFEMELSAIRKQVEKYSDLIQFAGSSNDILINCKNGKKSAILTIEGTAGFNYDPTRLEELHQKGFRITTLGWNEKNCLSGSHKTGGGLTAQGREYVNTAQSLGMVVDVSHISDAAFWDIVDITSAPIIASHSNSRRVWPVSRNLTDEMFRAICQLDGVVGINLFSNFLGENPTLDTVCDHIFHFLDMDSNGTHIALGGDLDGCAALPSDFTDVQSYECLADRLIYRGLSNKMLANLFWNNALEVFTKCCT